MDLRRALLLFAIVLGVAAVVAALAERPAQRAQRTTTAPPAATPARSARPPAPVRLDGRGAPQTRTLELGRATAVVVAVDEPGQVQVRGLGLVQPAEPGDPAIFETLPTKRGRYQVLFTPAGGVRARALGELVSRPAK